MLGGREGPRKDPGVLGLSPPPRPPASTSLEAGEEGRRRPWAPLQPFCFLPHLTAPLPGPACLLVLPPGSSSLSVSFL